MRKSFVEHLGISVGYTSKRYNVQKNAKAGAGETRVTIGGGGGEGADRNIKSTRAPRVCRHLPAPMLRVGQGSTSNCSIQYLIEDKTLPHT